MADIFDKASEREMADREAAIAAHLQRIEDARLKPVGRCHNCAEILPAGQLFCDADCGSDHELRMRLRRY